MTKAQIKKLYDSYNNTLELLTNNARRGCKVAAKHLLVVLAQQEKTIQVFGWQTKEFVDGKPVRFEKK